MSNWSKRANFADIYLPRMRDRSMRSGTELAQDIQLTDWSRAREHVKNLSNQFSGVQISCDICTRFGRYLYSTKQCWIIISFYSFSQRSLSVYYQGFGWLPILCLTMLCFITFAVDPRLRLAEAGNILLFGHQSCLFCTCF